MSEVVNTTTDLPVKVWVALGFFDLALYKTDIENFAGVPMVDLRAPALSEYQRLAKRGFDLIFGALSFVVAIPIMALIALVIWIFDGQTGLLPAKKGGRKWADLQNVQIQDDGQKCRSDEGDRRKKRRGRQYHPQERKRSTRDRGRPFSAKVQPG